MLDTDKDSRTSKTVIVPEEELLPSVSEREISALKSSFITKFWKRHSLLSQSISKSVLANMETDLSDIVELLCRPKKERNLSDRMLRKSDSEAEGERSTLPHPNMLDYIPKMGFFSAKYSMEALGNLIVIGRVGKHPDGSLFLHFVSEFWKGKSSWVPKGYFWDELNFPGEVVQIGTAILMEKNKSRHRWLVREVEKSPGWTLPPEIPFAIAGTSPDKILWIEDSNGFSASGIFLLSPVGPLPLRDFHVLKLGGWESFMRTFQSSSPVDFLKKTLFPDLAGENISWKSPTLARRIARFVLTQKQKGTFELGHE